MVPNVRHQNGTRVLVDAHTWAIPLTEELTNSSISQRPRGRFLSVRQRRPDAPLLNCCHFWPPGYEQLPWGRAARTSVPEPHKSVLGRFVCHLSFPALYSSVAPQSFSPSSSANDSSGTGPPVPGRLTGRACHQTRGVCHQTTTPYYYGARCL